MLNLDERSSDGELSYAGGKAFNQMLKFVAPLPDRLVLTGYSAFNYIRYNQSDNGAALGAGVTGAQLQLYGKNFALNNNPYDEHYYKFNQVTKNTSFNYLDLKWDGGHGLTIEDQPYYYYYQNHTISPQGASDNVSTTPGPTDQTNGSSATFSGA